MRSQENAGINQVTSIGGVRGPLHWLEAGLISQVTFTRLLPYKSTMARFLTFSSPTTLGRGLTDSPPVPFLSAHRQRHRRRRLWKRALCFPFADS